MKNKDLLLQVGIDGFSVKQRKPSYLDAMLAMSRTVPIGSIKVFVRGSQSATFPANNPRIMTTWEPFYKSELKQANESIFYEIVLCTRCPQDADRLLKLEIVTEISETISNKSTVLATVILAFSRIVSEASTESTISSVISSELLDERTTCRLVLSPIENFIKRPILNLNSPISLAAAPKSFNPIVATYNFMNNINNNQIFCQELSIEPRLTIRIAQQVLKQISSSLMTSAVAWSVRGEHERFRQGFFKNDREAAEHGRLAIKFEIVGAKHLSSIQLSRENNVDSLDLIDRIKQSDISTFAISMFSKAGSIWGSENKDKDDNEDLIKLTNNKLHTFVDAHLVLSSSESRPSKLLTSGVQHLARLAGIDSSSSTKLIEDNTSKEERSVHLIRSNTEYMNSDPVYGSNSNMSSCPYSSPNSRFSARSAGVIITALPSSTIMTVYVHKSCLESGMLRFYVCQEEYNSTDGITSSPIGYCEIGLQRIVERSSQDSDMVDEWIDLNFIDGENKYDSATSASVQSKIMIRYGMSVASTSSRISSDSQASRFLSQLTANSDGNRGSESTQPSNAMTNHRIQITEKLLSEIDFSDPKLLSSSHDVIKDCHVFAKAVGFIGDDTCEISEITRKRHASMRHRDDTDISSSVSQEDIVLYGNRLDVHLPISWIQQHAKCLFRDVETFDRLSRQYLNWYLTGRTFRNSQLKATFDFQAVPINLHLQLFVSRVSGSDIPAVHECITCGASCAHYYGFENNSGTKGPKGFGLLRMERHLSQIRGRIEDNKLQAIESLLLQETAMQKVRERKQQLAQMSVVSGVDLSKQGKESVLDDDKLRMLLADENDAQSRSDQLLNALVNNVVDFESYSSEVAIRRVFVRSQILTVAVTAIVMRLQLIYEGFIAATTALAEKWIEFGIVLYFEGLISSTGTERGMLEDMVAGIAMLKRFNFVLKLKPTETGLCGNISEEEKKMMDDIVDDTATRTMQMMTTGCDVTIDEDFIVCIWLSQAAFDKLPACLHPETILTVYPILFNQGIDLKQTISNTVGESSPDNLVSGPGSPLDGPTFQFSINRKNLVALDDYCHKFFPIMKSSSNNALSSQKLDNEKDLATVENDYVESDFQESDSNQEAKDVHEESFNNPPSPLPISRQPSDYFSLTLNSKYGQDFHPVLHQLVSTVVKQGSYSKNTAMFREAYRACCGMLSAIHITFCKSGKDRTAMGVTLTQSRIVAGSQMGDVPLDITQPTPEDVAENDPESNEATMQLLNNANLMRIYGTRIRVAEKNIGRPKYSINLIQTKFMPALYKVPPDVSEDLIMATLNRDTT